MVQRICSNPECHKEYTVENDYDASMNCCSFECWEKIYCATPPELHFDPIIMPELAS